MYNIAIDGPAGAGKSTISQILAKKLGILYLDTGAMYRAIGLASFKQNIDIKDMAILENFLATTNIEIVYNNGNQAVIVCGEDVSKEIREHYVSALASDISAIPCVRLKLVELQRKIASKSSSVLDGRDIGTYVLPNAKYKFFLTAQPEERARRRCLELSERGVTIDYEHVLQDIITRDYNDCNREFAPLRRASDAVEIDCTHIGIEQVVAKILSFIDEDERK